MNIKNQNKKKISVSISQSNFDKIEKIVNENKEQTTSSVIDYSLDMSLEEVRELLKNPIALEEELLHRRLQDLKKLKEEETKKK